MIQGNPNSFYLIKKDSKFDPKIKNELESKEIQSKDKKL